MSALLKKSRKYCNRYPLSILPSVGLSTLCHFCSYHKLLIRFLTRVVDIRHNDRLQRTINSLYSGNPITSIFANSEDQDEMQHAAFHPDLHCL